MTLQVAVTGVYVTPPLANDGLRSHYQRPLRRQRSNCPSTINEKLGGPSEYTVIR